ncbi:uncharacterized protein B0H18DRAFT_930237 [Fomitopsis serialis]|uniref:uncharacterized protein n=1 Tax=Fomitopsis serialis TaxID=139415 RepID=UPI002007DE9F|nr:uncharacterized protein B0H18DRAFT_930237 [Neoantrodia serialis]KAH9930630.1 hypothetical protein B0H18DRAFT_930237 [Neoantrodia serialis]
MSENGGASLGGLDEDVSRHILRELSRKDLWSLLQTCRWLRGASMPLLFRKCTLNVRGPRNVIEPERFLPASFRPHVQTLVLRDACPDHRVVDGLEDPPHYFTDNHKLCGALPGPPLADRLRELPHLRSLRLTMYHNSRHVTHGLSWDTLRAVLSVPHLREFDIENMYLCPELRSGEQLQVNVESLSTITSFRYQLWQPREPLTTSFETAALSVVLSQLCETLETLDLASEPAPLFALSQLRCPRLRKLVYRGTPWQTLAAPFISFHTGMQDLRAFTLKLDVTPGTIPQVLWPAGYEGPFPWPELERLVISFPNPRDEVYDHLPSSLRALSLRCWPHVHVQKRPTKPSTQALDHNALLSSSAIRSILRRCSSLNLDHLEIEYRADDEDDALLRHVVKTFPLLTSLKIHRYRSALEIEEGRDVPVDHIAQMLVPLSRLRRLKIYLDLVRTPRPRPGPVWRSISSPYVYDAYAVYDFEGAVQGMAKVFAQNLSSSLREVIVYSVSESSPYWRIYNSGELRLSV